jgi:hypothetical protein
VEEGANDLASLVAKLVANGIPLLRTLADGRGRFHAQNRPLRTTSDVLEAHGMQGVRGSSPLSSTHVCRRPGRIRRRGGRQRLLTAALRSLSLLKSPSANAGQRGSVKRSARLPPRRLAAVTVSAVDGLE